MNYKDYLLPFHCCTVDFRIPVEESLWNPVNHKTYSYTKDYYLCQCPNSTENFNRQNITGNITVLSYNGVLNCTFDYPCQETVDGSEGNFKLVCPD